MDKVGQKTQWIRERIDERFATELTKKLIEANRLGNKDFILRIAALVPGMEPSTSHRTAFARLLLLIHPDKFGELRRRIEVLLVESKPEAIHQLLELANFDQKRADRQNTFRLTEENLEGLDEVLDEEFAEEEEAQDEDPEEDASDFDQRKDLNILDALRISEYGNLGVEIDFSLVGPDIEEAMLPGMGIVDLEGVSVLSNLRVLDASDNRLVDIDELSHLDKLEEFFCANNRVADIALLSCCESLRIVDISNNQILDISALLGLPRLEFANLGGNRIPKSQIQLLRNKGVEVIEG